jgi:3-oxoacyl-[acyl-carrier protein] reductase
MNLQLKDKNVLLTGASGLIGHAIARAFATEGARLALLARRPSALAALCADVVATGAAAPLTIECDLSSAAATDAVVATAAQRLGSLDVVVLAAGAAQGGVFWEIDDAAWQRNLEAKLFGGIRSLRAALPTMIAQRAGRIVVVAGNSARQPEPRMLPGAVANAGLIALVRGLAEELGPHGIAINAVNPGPVRSPRWEQMMQTAATRDGISVEAAEAPFIAKSALRRLATAEEIAQHVLFFASSRAAHLTGTALTIDGGSIKSV